MPAPANAGDAVVVGPARASALIMPEETGLTRKNERKREASGRFGPSAAIRRNQPGAPRTLISRQKIEVGRGVWRLGPGLGEHPPAPDGAVSERVCIPGYRGWFSVAASMLTRQCLQASVTVSQNRIFVYTIPLESLSSISVFLH